MTYEKLQEKYQPSRATYMACGYGPIMSANRADDFYICIGFNEKSEAISYMLMYLLKGHIQQESSVKFDGTMGEGWQVRFNPSYWENPMD